MAKLNRNQLKRLLLKEFKMMGMAPMGQMMHGSAYDEDDHYDEYDAMPAHDGGGHKGALSMEDCCKAVLCLIECCDCESTKAKIRQCCEEILGNC